ncbi:Rhodanese-like domain-containing protein [Gongronella butleri]|nr:Rhodanese-like domain-containing protein [Gongronella butleri]
MLFLQKRIFTGAALTRSFSTSSILASRWSDLVKKTRQDNGIQEVNSDELNTALGGNEAPLVIDVRETAEVAQGKIPTAVTVPRGILELQIEKLVSPDSDRKVVLYCAGGLRSIMAAASLVGMGYSKDKVQSLQGGYGAWVKQGYKTEIK